jgi:phenylpropionate dioxygenase-like ring-hydroxylating dioxygenase large terminal subunit
METTIPYLRNAWYVAALSTEVGPEALFHRTLLDTAVMIYRKADGTPVAMHDRCPHRFAPLHLGKRVGDEVACLYHALQFNCEGKCTKNPHGNGSIPKAAQVRIYPLLERYGFVWIWMGDAPADPSKLPDFATLDDGPATGVAHTYLPMQAHYELIIDNVMDLSHVDHVHGEVLSTRGQLTPLVPRLREGERMVSARWEWQQTPPIQILAAFLPEPMLEARHFVEVSWSPPATIQLTIGCTQDAAVTLDLEHTIGQYDLHTCTPESAGRTHYFFATRRNHRVDDAEFNTMKIQAMHAAFELEDGPIITAIHEEMGTSDFFSLAPVLMSNDVAPVKVRRLLKKLIAAESAPA